MTAGLLREVEVEQSRMAVAVKAWTRDRGAPSRRQLDHIHAVLPELEAGG